MKGLSIHLVTLMLALGLSLSAHAGLIDRGGGLIYDTDLDITWLQDANYARTAGYDADGFMNWNAAMTWAANLSYGGYDDWRLPTTLQPDPSCSIQSGGLSWGYHCTGSEMGHLYHTELGNLAGSLTNPGPFINVPLSGGTSSLGWWWSATEYLWQDDLDHAWRFAFQGGFYAGGQFGADKPDLHYAWAVRDGDVAAPVPEPATLLLLGSGLVGLAAWRKVRR